MRTFQSLDPFLQAKQPLLEQGFEDSYLYLDGGNTALKWAIWQEQTARFEYYTLDWEQPDLEIQQQFIESVRTRYRFLILSSVRSDAASRLQSMLKDVLAPDAVIMLSVDHSLINTIPASAFPIQNAYENPEKLGIDRLIVAYGVQSRLLSDEIRTTNPTTKSVAIIDIGSALTIDVLSVDVGNKPESTFHGGVIAPGIEAIRTGMRHKTPSLPKAADATELNLETAPSSTSQAILWGQDFFWLKGMLGILNHYTQLYSLDEVYLTGGGAQAYICEAIMEAGLACSLVPTLQFDGMKNVLSRLTDEL